MPSSNASKLRKFTGLSNEKVMVPPNRSSLAVPSCVMTSTLPGFAEPPSLEKNGASRSGSAVPLSDVSKATAWLNWALRRALFAVTVAVTPPADTELTNSPWAKSSKSNTAACAAPLPSTSAVAIAVVLSIQNSLQVGARPHLSRFNLRATSRFARTVQSKLAGPFFQGHNSS